MAVEPGDERRHQRGPQPGWEESWYFDFVSDDGSIGGYVRLALHPAAGTAWYWAVVAGPGRPLVAVRDHDVAPPAGRALEVRSSGLWSDLVCETPLDHWTVGLEAFGVGLDDPLDAWGDERGDHVGLGFDLEWEGVAGCHARRGGGGYQQACTVSGDVLVGAGRFSVDGSGTRSHAWGPRDWASAGWWWAAGRLDDGAAFAVGADDGFLVPAGRPQADTVEGRARTDVGADGLPRRAELEVGGLALVASPLAHAPVLVPSAGGRSARLARALCAYDAGDGRSGWGWAEWLNPA